MHTSIKLFPVQRNYYIWFYYSTYLIFFYFALFFFCISSLLRNAIQEKLRFATKFVYIVRNFEHFFFNLFSLLFVTALSVTVHLLLKCFVSSLLLLSYFTTDQIAFVWRTISVRKMYTQIVCIFHVLQNLLLKVDYEETSATNPIHLVFKKKKSNNVTIS